MAIFTRNMIGFWGFDIATSPVDAEHDVFMGADTNSSSQFIHSTTPMSQDEVEFGGDASVVSRRSSANQDHVIECVIERLNEYADQLSRSTEDDPTCLNRSGRGVKNLRKLAEHARKRNNKTTKPATLDERLETRRNGIDLERL